MRKMAFDLDGRLKNLKNTSTIFSSTTINYYQGGHRLSKWNCGRTPAPAPHHKYTKWTNVLENDSASTTDLSKRVSDERDCTVVLGRCGKGHDNYFPISSTIKIYDRTFQGRRKQRNARADWAQQERERLPVSRRITNWADDSTVLWRYSFDCRSLKLLFLL